MASLRSRLAGLGCLLWGLYLVLYSGLHVFYAGPRILRPGPSVPAGQEPCGLPSRLLRHPSRGGHPASRNPYAVALLDLLFLSLRSTSLRSSRIGWTAGGEGLSEAARPRAWERSSSSSGSRPASSCSSPCTRPGRSILW